MFIWFVYISHYLSFFLSLSLNFVMYIWRFLFSISLFLFIYLSNKTNDASIFFS